MNRKKWLITLIVIFVIGSILGLLFWWYQNTINAEKEIRNDIITSFNENVKVTETTSLWKKEANSYIEIGTIEKDTELYLKKTPINSIKDHYYQIEDTPYYIDYKKVEAIDIIEQDKVPYLLWNEDVVTKESYSLSRGEKICTINESATYQIISKHSEYYEVRFQNRLFQIPITEVAEVVESLNTGEEATQTISVLYFTNNPETKIKEAITNLKNNGAHSITMEDYRLWQQTSIRLPIKTVVLLFDEISDDMRSYLTSNQFQGIVLKDIPEKWSIKNETSKQGQTETIPIYKVDKTVTSESLIKMIQGEKVPIKEDQSSPYATSIAVLNYHFFYNSAEGNRCGESICLPIQKFEEQLKYLKDNGYKTLTMEEYRAWMYQEIDLPKKSVLLTIDDGAMGTSKINGNLLIPMLEKYNMHATLFLITAWWDKANYSSPNLDVESHGYDIHKTASCNGSSKARALCLSKSDLVNDLKHSTEILGTTKAFCYPFYAYNNTVIEAVKETGFSLAFGGGGVKSKRTNHKYKIPRYVIYDNITMNQFIKMIN